MTQPAKNTVCLWFDGTAEEAARFYAKTFPDSSVSALHRAPGDFPSGHEGDVLMVEPVAIDPEETSGELFDRVSAVGAKTLVDALAKIEAGQLTPVPQDHSKATLAPPLTKDMAQFDFTQDAAHIHNWVRGMNPWPVAWFAQDGKRIKVLESRLAENPLGAAPGTVLALKPLTIAAANGAVALLTVTPEGGKPMAGTAWAAGRRLKAGDSL